MATRERRAAPRRAAEEDAPAPSASGNTQARAEEIREDLDALIDDIDEVMEENAEEFVRNYVQYGGE